MQRQIDPVYSHRYTPDAIRQLYPDLQAAFEAGDFMLVSEYASDPELKGCALILGGLLHRGIDMLSAVAAPSARSRLCLAYARWALDDSEGALREAALIDDGTPASGRMRDLIIAERIPVFLITAHLPVFTVKDPAASIPVRTYGQFEAKYVGCQLEHNAYDYSPDEPFDEFIDRLPDAERPAFIFATTPQWILPRNLERVQIPKAMWSHDADSFLYRALDNFRLFDVQIVMTAHEHFELSRMTGEYCASNVMSNTLCERFPTPETEPRTRDIDVFFSGSALHTWHTEKPRFLFQLSKTSAKRRICVLDGHLPEAAYLKLLKRAKAVPIVGRHAGNASPRWRDSLSKGVCLLYPSGTGYGNFSPACLPYDPDNVATSIDSVFSGASGREPPWNGTAAFDDIDRQFAPARVSRDKNFERLLKFVAFMCLVWRKDVPRPAVQRQRRAVWLTPWIDCSIFGYDNVIGKFQKLIGAIRESDTKDEAAYNNAAQVNEHCATVIGKGPQADIFRESALRWIERGLARHPTSLLLRFNQAYFTFFRDGPGNQAARPLFEKVIADFDTLNFDPVGSDVAGGMLRTGSDVVFPHYEYAHLVLQWSIARSGGQAPPGEPDPRQVVRAACFGFVGYLRVLAGDERAGLSQIDQALRLFPTNVPLSKTRFDLLLARVNADKYRDAETMQRCVDAFFAYADQYPTVLLTHIGSIIKVLDALGWHDQLAAVAEQWYGFASIVYAVKTQREWRLELSQICEITARKERMPPALKDKMISWTRGTIPAEGCSQIDMLLYALTTKRKISWLHQQNAMPIVPFGLTRPTLRQLVAESIDAFLHFDSSAIRLLRKVMRNLLGQRIARAIYRSLQDFKL